MSQDNGGKTSGPKPGGRRRSKIVSPFIERDREMTRRRNSSATPVSTRTPPSSDHEKGSGPRTPTFLDAAERTRQRSQSVGDRVRPRKGSTNGPSRKGKISSPFLDAERRRSDAERQNTMQDEQPEAWTGAASSGKVQSPFLDDDAPQRRRSQTTVTKKNDPWTRERSGRRQSVFNRAVAKRAVANRKMSAKAQAYLDATKRAQEEEARQLAAKDAQRKQRVSSKVQKLRQVFLKPKKDAWTGLMKRTRHLKPNKVDLSKFNKTEMTVEEAQIATAELGDIGSLLEDALEKADEIEEHDQDQDQDQEQQQQQQQNHHEPDTELSLRNQDAQPEASTSSAPEQSFAFQSLLERDVSLPDLSAKFQSHVKFGHLTLPMAQKLLRKGCVHPLPTSFLLLLHNPDGTSTWTQINTQHQTTSSDDDDEKHHSLQHNSSSSDSDFEFDSDNSGAGRREDMESTVKSLWYVGEELGQDDEDNNETGGPDLTDMLVNYGCGDSFARARAFFAARDMKKEALYDTQGKRLPSKFRARLVNADGVEMLYCFSLKPTKPLQDTTSLDAALAARLQAEENEAAQSAVLEPPTMDANNDAQLALDLQRQESVKYAQERRLNMAFQQRQAEEDRQYAEELRQKEEETLRRQEEKEELDRQAAQRLADRLDAEAKRRNEELRRMLEESDSDSTISDDGGEGDSEVRPTDEGSLKRDRVRLNGRLEKQHRNTSWEMRYFVLQGDYLHYYSMTKAAAETHGPLLGQYELEAILRVKHKKQDGRRRLKLYFSSEATQAASPTKKNGGGSARIKKKNSLRSGGTHANANGRATVRLRAPSADLAQKWVTQLSNAIAERDKERKLAIEAANRRARGATAAQSPDNEMHPRDQSGKQTQVCAQVSEDDAQPSQVQPQAGPGASSPQFIQVKQKTPSISQSIAESVSASMEKSCEKLTRAGYVFESLEIFTEYQFDRAYSALEKIIDTERGQTVLVLEAKKATGRHHVTEADYANALTNLIQLLRNEVTKFCASWWDRQAQRHGRPVQASSRRTSLSDVAYVDSSGSPVPGIRVVEYDVEANSRASGTPESRLTQQRQQSEGSPALGIVGSPSRNPPRDDCDSGDAAELDGGSDKRGHTAAHEQDPEQVRRKLEAAIAKAEAQARVAVARRASTGSILPPVDQDSHRRPPQAPSSDSSSSFSTSEEDESGSEQGSP